MYYPEKQKNSMLKWKKRDYENIANYSCIPWVDFESITSGILTGNQIQPLITWGKVNENYEMSVAITVSHIFVNGSELGLFYKKFRKILISQSRANLFLIIQKIKVRILFKINTSYSESSIMGFEFDVHTNKQWSNGLN